MAEGMSGYLGLLKWSLNYTDGTGPAMQEMDPERKEWLLKAFEEIVRDPIDDVKVLLKVLELDTSEQPTESKTMVIEKQAQALQDIQDNLECMDLTADFIKIQGLETLQNLMNREVPLLRSGAASVVGAAVQNHPQAQAHALEIDLVGTLASLIDKRWEEGSTTTATTTTTTTTNAVSNGDHSTEEATVIGSDKAEVVKLLTGVSCLVRSHAETTSRFLNEHGGISLLLKIITSTYTLDTQIDSRAKRKALFLLSYIVNEHAGDVVVRCDASVLYPALIDALKSEDLDTKENAAGILAAAARHKALREHMGIERVAELMVIVNELMTASDSGADVEAVDALGDLRTALSEPASVGEPVLMIGA